MDLRRLAAQLFTPIRSGRIDAHITLSMQDALAIPAGY
jgi:hypothetical protein